jgi:hypothetical protein
MHRGVALMAVLSLLGCSSSPSPADDGSPPITAKEAASLSRKAEAQAEDPGTEVRSFPSSFPGVTEWKVYMGSAVTIFGTDDAGRPQAIVTWVARQEGMAISCSTHHTSAATCASVARGLVTDLRTTPSGTSPTSVHPLAEPSSEDPCPPKLRGGMDSMAKSLADQGYEIAPNSSTGACNSSDNSNGLSFVAPGSCWVNVGIRPTGSSGTSTAGATNRPSSAWDFAEECCPKDQSRGTREVDYSGSSASGSLVKGSLMLVCKTK